jgi:hypothetical protein
MNWQSFDEFYRIIRKDSLSLFYSGDFLDDITTRLIDLSELSFSDSDGSPGVRKKVSFLIAECFQNVIRHSSFEPGNGMQPERRGFFMTRNIGRDYYIASGNLIKNEDIGDLRSRITNINNLGKSELKELYLNVLGMGEISAKGGAGLGLIDMARKSGRKLDAIFQKIDDQYADFYLQIYIGQEEEQETQGKDHLKDSSAIRINEFMRRNEVMMAYQGDFCQDAILPILTMIDKNLAVQTAEKAKIKNLYHTLVEILQNIMHHGYVEEDKTEGVFTIGKDRDCYYIDAANYISNTSVPLFRDSLEQLVAMDLEGLRAFYKKVLKEGLTSPGGGAGLGLFDIMRLSREQPVFRFEQEDEEKTLFFFSVKI